MYRYIIFHIKDDKVIDVETTGDRDASYDDYLNYLVNLGPEQCRYGIYDFEYDHQCQGTTDSTRKQKLFLMSWCPDTAKIKKKMLYSSSFDALKQSLEGIGKYIQATDMAEASYECVLDKMRSTDRT
ncbi:cofilin/actin-depolymerizing factor homolog isoform X2 [Macrobrachium rosenbergii]